MRNSLFKFILQFCILLFVVATSALGQNTRQLNEAGDVYFDKGSYFQAVEYYQRSLGINNKDKKALYKLGESFRYLFDYKQAQGYYKRVSELYPDNYPLSLYYYPLMLKRNGKYDEAIINFDKFIKFAANSKSKTLAENPEFLEQAYVEKEGSLLALNLLSAPPREYNFKILPEPVNSEYNDFGATSLDGDNSLVLASGRKGSKGGTNTRTGESFADNYRYQSSGKNWSAFKSKDGFNNLNTKVSDGSGIFNTDRNKYYFSRCNEDGKDECRIFVTTLSNGKWGEPVALNKNINIPKFHARHPALSQGGDTLFFSSDREGGMGGQDIWMSISSGIENWGTPINLGEDINTLYDESAPYYFDEENTLFFASNGHKGFGGFDIFFTKGDLSDPDIFNMGRPFNSERDDAYFSLSINRGYLTSNRSKGIGKFDVYGFDYKTGREVIAELENEDAIAGRNTLYSDDFEFDAENSVLVEKIISILVAAQIYGVELAFTDDELEFFNGLSGDDKKRISRIVKSRVRNLSRSNLATVRDEDQFYYENLGDDEKEHVDGIISKYLEDKSLDETIDLEQEDEEYYSSLSTQQKQKLERLIAFRLKNQSENSKSVESIIYSGLSDEEKAWVDKAAVSYVKSKADFLELDLSDGEKEFYNSLNEEQQLEKNGALYFRITELSKEEKNLIEEKERKFYNNLSVEDQGLLKSIASTLLTSGDEGFFNELSSEEKSLLDNFSGDDKRSADKIISNLILNLSDADNYIYETLSSEEKERLSRISEAKASNKYRDFVNGLNASDKDYYNSLSKADKDRVNRLSDRYALQKSVEANGLIVLDDSKSRTVEPIIIDEELDVIIESSKLTTEEKKNVKSALRSGLAGINKSSLEFFNQLSTEDKNKVSNLLELNVLNNGGDITKSNDSKYNDDIRFYTSLSNPNKNKVDEIINYPLLKTDDYVKSMPKERRIITADAAKKYLITKAGSLSLAPSGDQENYYNNLDELGQSTVDRASLPISIRKFNST